MTTAQAATPELEALIARTSLKYDLLPYTSNPFPQTHPARLAAIARMFGLQAAPVETARVLELGCAAGGNLIPHAVRYPNAKFLGVDLARSQVAAGRMRIAQLGIGNCEIQCKSFTELDASAGPFDYVICHGVYSWVPGPVKHELLKICRQQLAPNGIAIVSYNVLPGWRMLQAIRDCFLLHVGNSLPGKEHVAKARELLQFLKEAAPDNGAYKQLLESWSLRLGQLPDDYVGHEFLEEINEPCTFNDFVSSAAQHGLTYLGDCDLPSMIMDNQPAHIAQKLRELGRNQQIATEQYLDMATGRTFRQTLLVKADLQNAINRNLTPAVIEGLSFLTGDLKIERTPNGGGSLTDAAGRRLTVEGSEMMESMTRFGTRFPASSTIGDLLGTNAKDGSLRPALVEAVYKMVITGLAIPMAGDIAAVPRSAGNPVAWPVARSDASQGMAATTNLRHERIGLDPLAQVLLPAMDGTRSVAGLTDVASGAIEAGRINLSKDGKPLTRKPEIAEVLQAHVEATVAGIGRTGLLTG